MSLKDKITKAGLSPYDIGQIAMACDAVYKYLGESLIAVHLYGSALETGGLKPYSDIDLFVTVDTFLTDHVREQLMHAFLSYSALPGTDPRLRALEVTIVNYQDINPWRYPPKREMQFGEWLRDDIQNGVFEPAVTDIDLTVILKKIRSASIPIIGQNASELFEPIPDDDFIKVLQETMLIWNSEEDWSGDERNVLLTIARIWYSAATGEISSKEEAAIWLIDRIPLEYHPLILKARNDYLLGNNEDFGSDSKEIEAFVNFAKYTINQIIKA